MEWQQLEEQPAGDKFDALVPNEYLVIIQRFFRAVLAVKLARRARAPQGDTEELAVFIAAAVDVLVVGVDATSRGSVLPLLES